MEDDINRPNTPVWDNYNLLHVFPLMPGHKLRPGISVKICRKHCRWYDSAVVIFRITVISLCAFVVVACVSYPCLFVSCEQRGGVAEPSLSNLCLCQPLDNADCGVIRVIPRRHHPTATSSDCLRPRMICRCDSNDRRQRRTAACRERCGRFERRAANPTATDKCRNGGTPAGLSALGSSAPCQCRAGYFGDSCQLLDPCSDQPCRNGGYCRSLIDLTGDPLYNNK